ncbi:MAG: PAS domain S-box protein [Methanolobus sp.]
MKPKIFLVKNGPHEESSFRRIIENDFNVTEVFPCDSVFSLLETSIPDLVVIDEDIHDPAAYELCQQIKLSDKYHFIPVIFKGPPISSGEKVQYVKSGADDYYEEPFDSYCTVDYLNALVGKRENFRCLADKYEKLKKDVSDRNINVKKCLDTEEEELFKATFQQSAVGIVRTSPEGDFQKVNKRFCDIVGYTGEELLSMNYMDITYPDKSGFEKEMISWMRAGEIDSYEVEKRYIHKNGSPVWVKLFSNVIRDESGSIKYIVCIIEDISSQKRAESLLHESEGFFRTMYESSGIGIVKMSVHDKRIKQANAAFCNMLGYTEKELIGKLLREISYTEDLAENVEKHNMLINGEISSIQMEKRYLHKDGHHVWGLLNANLIFDVQGLPLYFIGNVLDITEIKNSQRLLRESEEKYRTYVNNSPYPIFAANPNGEYVDANPAACAITGYSWEELTKMKIAELCAAEYHELAAESYKKILKGEKVSEEYLFIKKDGTRFYMLVSAVLIKDTVLGICVDTTERKMTEKLLIEAKMLAEDASKSKTEFVANVSHELRTPLNIVIGYSDLLLSDISGTLNEKQRKFAHSVKNAGSNLLEIVNSLIYIAEIESGDWEIHKSIFDVASVIVEMEKVTRVLARKKSVSLEFEVGTDIDEIYADKMKIKIILHHLIGNSIKFTSEGGSVKVVIKRSGKNVEVSVIDTGIGIPEEEKERLFDPFVQLDWSHARKYSGVGIGLFLVKELIEMHGGNISLKSRVGEGTNITFTIPQTK